MHRTKIFNTIIAVFLLSVLSFAQQNFKSITVEQLQKKIATDSTLVVLDVRTPRELKGPLGHIKGVVNIPVQNLEDRINELNKYKNRPIMVICRSGHRSGMATPILIKHKFKATNVLGGMLAWDKMIEKQKMMKNKKMMKKQNMMRNKKIMKNK